MFPDHGKAHPGPLRDVKEILKNRYLSGRRTSAKDMYKDNVISEADMCDAAKRLVGKGLPARGLMLRKIVTVNGKGLNFTPQYLNN